MGAKAIEFFPFPISLFPYYGISLFSFTKRQLNSSLFTLHSSFPKASAFFTFLPFYFFTFKTSSVSHFFIIFARIIIKTMRV